MNDTEKKELDSLHQEACLSVLKGKLIENQVLQFGVTGINLGTPEGLSQLGCAISGVQTK